MVRSVIEIKKVRGRFVAFAGVAKLTRSFKTEAECSLFVSENFAFLSYWANSAGVSIQNTPAVVKVL